MIRTILFITALVTTCCAFGQSTKKKSEASKRYSEYKASSNNQASVLLQEAYALKNANPGEALNKVEDALGISIAQKDAYNEAKCYVLIGEINESIQEWKLAQDYFKTAYQKLKQDYSKTPEYVTALKGLGSTSLKLKEYAAALQYYEEVLNQREHSGDTDIHLAIGEVYYQQGRYEAAMEVVQRLLNGTPKDAKVVSRSSDANAYAALKNLETRIEARKNELSNPGRVFENSVNAVNDKNVTPTQVEAIQQTKEEVSNTLRGQQRYNEDVDLRTKSIEFNKSINNLEGVAKDQLEVSKSLADLGENNAALNALEEAARIADKINNPEAKAEAYLALANFYEKEGKSKQAIASYKKYSDAVRSTKKVETKENEQRDELLDKQREIENLSKEVYSHREQERYEQLTVARQQLIIYGLIGIILIVATTSYFIYKNAAASKVANQLLALKSLRSQMNPHFIFNALNSVNHFIAQQDERTANKFLSEFSLLMRLVLENSQEDFIPLHKEQEILSLYLKLEHYRFRDKFDYTIEVDEGINSEAIEVPPMLIQPYIENAVWHGLRYKETKGHLRLKFEQVGDSLFVEVHDDGIGRKKSAALKTVNQKKHNSTGLRNIQERLSILNTVYKTQYSVTILDPADGEGTIVKIALPINHPKLKKA